MKPPFYYLSWIFVVLLLPACESPVEELRPPAEVEGMRPIYATEVDWQNIQQSGPREIRRLGKIYYKDGFIFVNELNEGIHIIDNSNPAQPEPLYFIAVPGSKDIAIKGDYLYTDNLQDLLVLDISNLDDITVANRLPGVYDSPSQAFPEFWQGHFECPDPEQGLVVGWELATLHYPECRTE